MKKLMFHSAPKPAPQVEFEREDGSTATLADYQGQHIVLNFWATWCAPCRVEMPMLSNLQAEMGGEDFAVVTIATGRNPPPAMKAFFDEIGVDNLPLHRDDSQRVARAMGVLGLPVTIILDRDGQEIAFDLPFVGMRRLTRVGLVWDSPVVLDLHAFEFGAEVYGDGHVFPGNRRSFDTIGVELKPIPSVVVKADYQISADDAGTGRDQLNMALGYACYCDPGGRHRLLRACTPGARGRCGSPSRRRWRCSRRPSPPARSRATRRSPRASPGQRSRRSACS